MTEVISVRFRNKGKIYFFDPAGLNIPQGSSVIVETAKGLEYAECVQGNHSVEDNIVILPLRPVVRIATPEDRERAESNRKKEAAALAICREKITKHQLEMKLVDVEYNFEGNKILFFFTSDGRVDFRELVKDLAGVFKTRIELRQIGIRDEARMLGGLGICGKQFCCSQFLDDFQPVSIKMAKTQGLSLNPVKISGTCGRLMCCLKYEQNAYEDLVKNVPKVDSFVETPMGKGSVVDVNLLRARVRVRLDEGGDTTLKTFNASEVEVIGGKSARSEYLAARAELQAERAASAPPRELSRPPLQKGASHSAAQPPSETRDTSGEQRQKSGGRPNNSGRRRPSQNAKGGQAGHVPQQKKATAEKPADAPQGEKKKSGSRRRRRGPRPGGAAPQQPQQ